mgnify:FL=1
MINFHNEIEFVLQNQQELRRWIKKVITSENKEMGEINYIFCSDEYLLEKNIKYLDHDTLTDIITFNYCKGQIITSDIMISIDRVKENSTIFDNSFSEELHRVMIHGILHLIGYDDKTEKEKKLMREKENFYLKKLCN